LNTTERRTTSTIGAGCLDHAQRNALKKQPHGIAEKMCQGFWYTLRTTLRTRTTLYIITFIRMKSAENTERGNDCEKIHKQTP